LLSVITKREAALKNQVSLMKELEKAAFRQPYQCPYQESDMGKEGQLFWFMLVRPGRKHLEFWQ
jgi:hypothetical protein